jgi:lipid-A-disaccharide synthase
MNAPAATRVSTPLRVGLVAGEASGDTLGADLIHSLRRRAPDTQFFGVAGPKMQAAGCESWEPAESLAVMGLFDVLRDLPRLVRLLARIKRMFLTARPDVFIGIDAPDTNLRLARTLHAAGIPTVQYVSPQVWAWRQGRARRIRQSVDLVLCLLPFEKRFYDEHGIRAEFVGHPLADAIPQQIDREAARSALGLDLKSSIVALLPGSRRGEVARLGADFAATARWLAAQRPDLKFIAPMASAATRQIFSEVLKRDAPALDVRLIDGQATTALSAANVVLVASGTASLEAALCKRPMVVVYRLGALTGWVLTRLNLVKSKFFAQPNLLADQRVVGEYFQDQIIPESIGAELLMWLDDTERRGALEREFSRIHADLRRGAGTRAAQAILDLLNAGSPSARGPLR